ncbi:MAG: FemAB family protein [Pelotomaculum sp. PtaU1.Bin065]|nr:MAG: FemAB family protein [Pelotomaculum sp. PtaU1.Bin065]
MITQLAIVTNKKYLDEITKDILRNVLLSCPWSTFYHDFFNMRLIKKLTKAVSSYLIASDKERIVGFLPYAVQDGVWGTVVNSLPYYGSYGSAAITDHAPPETEELLYQALLDECVKANAVCLTVITSPFDTNGHRTQVQSLLKPTYINQRNCQITHLPLYSGESREVYEEKVMTTFEGRARTAIRKARKEKFTIRRTENEDEALEFAAIHKQNIGGKGGIFKEKEFFIEAFRASLVSPDNAEIAIITEGEKIIAGVVLFYFKDTVEYHTTCLREKYKSLGLLNLIIFERMVDAGMKGYRYWNFGGTWKSQEGVYRFKKSFGAFDYQYEYLTVFFRDLETVKSSTAEQIRQFYPHCFVIPFDCLGDSKLCNL